MLAVLNAVRQQWPQLRGQNTRRWTLAWQLLQMGQWSGRPHRSQSIKGFPRVSGPTASSSPAVSRPRIEFPLDNSVSPLLKHQGDPSRWKSFRVALKLEFLWLKRKYCAPHRSPATFHSSRLETCPSEVTFTPKTFSLNCILSVGIGESDVSMFALGRVNTSCTTKLSSQLY